MATATQWLPQSEATALRQNLCRFVARQPIVDRRRRTFGYELLFRTSWENSFSADGDTASLHMVDNAISFGLESLVGASTPFINCTQSTLLTGLPKLLPNTTVLEILETIDPTPEIVEACRDLRAYGYPIALDDYDFSPAWEPLLPLASYIKVDFRCSTRQQRLNLIHRLRSLRIRFVAEKVETQDEYRSAIDEGFNLFQGYFFTRPQVLARPNLSTIVNRLRFLGELNTPTLDRIRMLNLLKEEPSISYRVLRMANSPVISTRDPVRSLSCAMALIGDEHFRRIATLALTSVFSSSTSLEPIRCILQRARLCELLGTLLDLEANEMYLIGMLSVLHDTLQLPPQELVRSLHLGPEVADAFDGVMNQHGIILRLAAAYEAAQWDAVQDAVGHLGLAEADVSASAIAAHLWAEDILEAARLDALPPHTL